MRYETVDEFCTTTSVAITTKKQFFDRHLLETICGIHGGKKKFSLTKCRMNILRYNKFIDKILKTLRRTIGGIPREIQVKCLLLMYIFV